MHVFSYSIISKYCLKIQLTGEKFAYHVTKLLLVIKLSACDSDRCFHVGIFAISALFMETKWNLHAKTVLLSSIV